MRVIARNSGFVYKRRSVDVREAAKQLGVRYILEGSVRKSGNRLQITAHLIDAKGGTHLWAERYDRRCPADARVKLASSPTSDRVGRRWGNVGVAYVFAAAVGAGFGPALACVLLRTLLEHFRHRCRPK
jgi:hypothetical protein